MKYKDIANLKISKEKILASRDCDSFEGFLIIFKDDDKSLMNSTVITSNSCPLSMIEGTATYEFWRGKHDSLYKEDLEADDWYYYLV